MFPFNCVNTCYFFYSLIYTIIVDRLLIKQHVYVPHKKQNTQFQSTIKEHLNSDTNRKMTWK